MTLNLTNLPDDIGRALFERAAAEQKSVEAVAIAAIAQSLGHARKVGSKTRSLIYGSGAAVGTRGASRLGGAAAIDLELWK